MPPCLTSLLMENISENNPLYQTQLVNFICQQIITLNWNKNRKQYLYFCFDCFNIVCVRSYCYIKNIDEVPNNLNLS